MTETHRRDLQKRLIKETYRRDLLSRYPYLRYVNMSKETPKHDKRAKHMKRDQNIWKETNILGKRAVYLGKEPHKKPINEKSWYDTLT